VLHLSDDRPKDLMGNRSVDRAEWHDLVLGIFVQWPTNQATLVAHDVSRSDGAHGFLLTLSYLRKPPAPNGRPPRNWVSRSSGAAEGVLRDLVILVISEVVDRTAFESGPI